MDPRVFALIEEATQAARGTVTAATSLAELDGWDSMGVVHFLGELSDRLNVQLSADDVEACGTAGDLALRVARGGATA